MSNASGMQILLVLTLLLSTLGRQRMERPTVAALAFLSLVIAVVVVGLEVLGWMGRSRQSSSPPALKFHLPLPPLLENRVCLGVIMLADEED